MLTDFPIKKLVLEWRYAPDLSFYNKMDECAIRHKKEFPDWERSALSVEVRDKKRHRRVHFSAGRSFFEVDKPTDYLPQVDCGRESLATVTHALGITELKRLGFRHWFAADLDRSFPALVDVIHSRFYAAASLKQVIEGEIVDSSYHTDYEHQNGWKFNLRVGPMEHRQWFEIVRYERLLYGAEDETSFRDACESFPKQFVYIDIDYHKNDVKVADVIGLLAEMREHCRNLVRSVIQLCQEENP